ncbi:MAG: DUF1045 domain-containing protein [Pseudomonadota bacterium]
MTPFQRYAIYMLPDGPLADLGAEWLGWDVRSGSVVDHPTADGLQRPVAELTDRPRKYGFHGTIKAPFRLKDGTSANVLQDEFATFCAATQAVTLAKGLSVNRLGRFLALTPTVPSAALSALAASSVQSLDLFRAPPSAAELVRRRKAGLSERQDAMLLRWGYPYVMEEFRFHITLTGPLKDTEADQTESALRTLFAPVLTAPYTIDTLCLVGEAEDGRFRLIDRHTLSG